MDDPELADIHHETYHVKCRLLTITIYDAATPIIKRVGEVAASVGWTKDQAKGVAVEVRKRVRSEIGAEVTRPKPGVRHLRALPHC